MNNYRLNDLFYFAKDELKMYSYTGNKQYIVKALYWYKQYKDKQGKKVIERL